MNRITRKWMLTGLLEGLDKEGKDKTASSLEDMATVILSKEKIDKNAVEYLFPIIRRLAGSDLYPETNWLYEDFTKMAADERWSQAPDFVETYTKNLKKRMEQ